MGVILSSLIGVIGMVVAGIMTSIAASKADDCGDAKKICIFTAIGEFVAAIVMILLMIFLL